MRQARPRSGADHDLACRTRPEFAATIAGRELCQRPSSLFFAHGAGFPMGNSLAKVLTTFSLVAAHGGGGAPAHVAREIYLGKSYALSRDPGTRRCEDEVVPSTRLARDVSN